MLLELLQKSAKCSMRLISPARQPERHVFIHQFHNTQKLTYEATDT